MILITNNNPMEFEILNLEITNNIAIVTINRPQALNALNTAFFLEMNKMLNHLGKNDNISVVIITGNGKAFVAGADIAEMSDMNSTQGENFSRLGQRTFNEIENFKYPVIAAINGFALGGGCELAMSCDIRIASSLAKFGQPEVSLGLITGYAGTQRLPRLVGTSNALMLLLSGNTIDANEALRIGLIQKISEPENLMNEALDLANKITSKGKNAVKVTKQVVRKGMNIDFVSACNSEAVEFGKLFDTDETKEGIKAFLEKRKPNW